MWRSEAALRRSLTWRVKYRIGVDVPDCFRVARRDIPCSMNIALNAPPAPQKKNTHTQKHFHKWQAPFADTSSALSGSPLQIDGIYLASLKTFSAPAIPVTTEVWSITVAWNRWVCTPLVNWFTGANWNQRTAINAYQFQAITDTKLVESFLPLYLLVRTHVFNRRMGSALQRINHWIMDKRSWDRNFCLFVLGNRLIVSQTFYYLFQSVKMRYPRQLVWTLYVFAISNKYIQSVLRLAASASVSIQITIRSYQ